jgi:hypothetical protein
VSQIRYSSGFTDFIVKEVDDAKKQSGLTTHGWSGEYKAESAGNLLLEFIMQGSMNKGKNE